MILPTLTQIAKGLAEFQCYKNRELWYTLEFVAEDKTHFFTFPIPVEDAGEGEFAFTMKGINVQRWARKHVELLKAARVGQENPDE